VSTHRFPAKLGAYFAATLFCAPLCGYAEQIVLWAVGQSSPAGFLRYWGVTFVVSGLVSAISLPFSMGIWNGRKIGSLLVLSALFSGGTVGLVGSAIALSRPSGPYHLADALRDAGIWCVPTVGGVYLAVRGLEALSRWRDG